MFDNGFGFQANYTYVKSDLTYDNTGMGPQFALIDADQRQHGRTDMQVMSITTGGPRHMLGARYKF